MTHLEHEHDAVDPNFNRNIERLTLLPDLQPLTWTINVSCAFVADENRFVCNIENCQIVFANANEFRNHFMQNHIQQHTFNCPHCNETVQKLHRPFIIDIIMHLQLHSSCLNECASCGEKVASDQDMLHHMGRVHYGEPIIYRKSKGRDYGELEKQECTILLQCNVCDARFENAIKATDHYVKTHKSHYIDFEAIKMVKRTAVDGVTSCFTPNEKKTFTVRRSLLCKLCEQMPKTKSALIDHFNRFHPMHEIIVKLGKIYVADVSWDANYKIIFAQNRSFDNHMVYHCAICHDAGQSSSLAFGSVSDVHAHWIQHHSNPPMVMPFHFYAVELVSCFYCNFISSFHEVKRHQSKKHEKQPLVITSVLDKEKCALCDYIGPDLAQHTKIQHELVLRSNTLNPTRFTDDLLNNLLAIDVHKKHKCGYCANFYETIGEIKSHVIGAHKRPIKYDTFFDGHSVKVFTGCCGTVVDLHEFLNHLADPNHKFPSMCSKCPFQTNEMLEFVDHQVNVHHITKDGDFLYRRLLQTRFWSSKVWHI